MKIIVWGINYAPEQTGIAPYNAGLCRHLAQSGHLVRMMTTFPYYPAWRKEPDAAGRLYRTDRLEGVTVHRCWHYVPPRPNAWKRMIHEATFVATSLIRMLTVPKPDLVVVISPPLLLGFAAWLVCLLKRTRFVFHVQDMQPDAAVMLGLLKPGLLTRVLYAFENLAYRKAAAVSGITPGMLTMFRRKGVPEKKLTLFPNWTEKPSGRDPARGAFRLRHGLPPDAFLAVYSGNLGRKQGLDILLDVAERLARDDAKASAATLPIFLVIAGDGVEKSALESRVARAKLSHVRLLPLQSAEGYRELLVDADACLVTQQPGSGALFFPSKLLTILAHARPVIAVADRDGELDRAISEGGFGWSVSPEDPERLAKVLKTAAASPSECAKRAEAGVNWVRLYERVAVLSRYENALRALHSDGSESRAKGG